GTVARVSALLAHRARLAGVAAMGLAERKRFLRMPNFHDHLELHRRWCAATGAPLAAYEFAAAHLQQDELFPPRLVTGDDLLAMGVRQGPVFQYLLEAVETEQLEERIATREEALRYVHALSLRV
ncbi:MAG: CCA tRNA nucleotidyltransferase, partial [Bryobacterales bacterium]|nr:CCA tRNA nucleotidyltransferase [Bryobacterales bacterium]